MCLPRPQRRDPLPLYNPQVRQQRRQESAGAITDQDSSTSTSSLTVTSSPPLTRGGMTSRRVYGSFRLYQDVWNL